MSKRAGILLAVGLLATTPAFAGTLGTESGKAVWHSTQCVKPVAPESVVTAHPETLGNDMNRLSAQQNAYVDAAQYYMNCIKDEAANDQTQIDKAIASDAQKAIADMQADVSASTAALHNRQSR